MNKKFVPFLLSTILLSGCISNNPSVTSSDSSIDNSVTSSESQSSSESSVNPSSETSSIDSSNEYSSESSSSEDASSSETSSETYSASENTSSPEDSSSNDSSLEDIDYETLFYDDFYNPESEIKLTIRIHDEYAYDVCYYGSTSNSTMHDIYSPMDLTVSVNGIETTFKECGIRLKGNMSRGDSQYFFDQYGNINGGGHFKISFNTTFDDNDYYEPETDASVLKARRFSKAKKIDLKWNRNSDATFTKEAYASHILEEEGLMAQKINLAKVKFITDSDEREFTYQVLECIDEEFIERRLPKAEKKGDLYKGGWNGSDNISLTSFATYLRGVEDVTEYKYYVYDLKTNKKKSTHAMLDNLIVTLNDQATYFSEAIEKETLESIVDIDYFLKFAALEWVIGNPDSWRYNYNNTYLYFNSGNNLLYPIMYDNDRCFGIRNTWEVTPDRWPTTTKDISGNMQNNPLYQAVICGGNSYHPLIEEYQHRYLDYVEDYCIKYLDATKFNEFTSRFKTIDNVNDGANYSFSYYANMMLGLAYDCIYGY